MAVTAYRSIAKGVDEVGLWCSSFHHYIEYLIPELPLLDVKVSSQGVLTHEFWPLEMWLGESFGHSQQLEVGHDGY